MTTTKELLGLVLSSELRTRIIHMLGERGPLKPVNIMNTLNIESSNAAVIMNLLHKKGLIENITDKQTWKVLCLTDRGWEIYNQLRITP